MLFVTRSTFDPFPAFQLIWQVVSEAYNKTSIMLPPNDSLKCMCNLWCAAKLSTYISPYSLMIVWTFTISFLGWRVLICSTTICTKVFCNSDSFFFPCLVSFSGFIVSFNCIEGARPHTMLKMRANPGFLQSDDSFFCFVLLSFPNSSYLLIFCIFFYYYSTLSWGFHTLNHPSHKNFILECL